MKTQGIVGPSGRFARMGHRCQAAACDAVAILSLASGFAAGFGVVGERLTTTTAASVSSSFPHVVDRWFDEPQA